MTTQIHITADSECWTGASTTALHAARAAVDAVVVSGLPDELLERYRRAGVKAERCKVGGMFGALNLSRVLRRISGEAFRVYVHSPSARPAVESALRLVGRPEPMELADGLPDILFPPVEVSRPAPGAEPMIMWLGNITPACSLPALVERLGALADRRWRLRVVGNGKARVAVPVLNRCKALGINDRIEWVGYSADPYEQMHGVSFGVAAAGSVAAREFAAASVPVVSEISRLNELI